MTQSTSNFFKIITSLVALWIIFISSVIYTSTNDVQSIMQENLDGVVIIQSLSIPAFGEAESLSPDERSQPKGSSGTGFFIDENLIVTNYHVVSEKNFDIQIRGHKSAEFYDARYIGGNEDSDISVIAINDWQKYKSDVPYKILNLVNSNDVEQGDIVYAIGHPIGLDFTLTKGIVAHTDRFLALDNKQIPFIQTDVSINHGNSGGPLLNEEGDVIAVNESIISPPDTGGNIPMSVHSNMVKKVVGNILNKEQVLFPKIGIELETGFTKYPRIKNIAKDSVGQKAELAINDVISAIESKNGKETVYVPEDLIIQIVQLNKGDQITLDIYRDGKLIKKDLTL